MNWRHIGAGVAAGGALLHVVFAYLEMCRWGQAFVDRVAPSWLKPPKLVPNLDPKDVVDWAEDLAFNVGAYNLALALGLGWTCWAFIRAPGIAGALGIFFSIWLLVAAAAALKTRVIPAFYLQGSVGVLLLVCAGIVFRQFG